MSFVASETFKLHLKHSSSCAARHPQIFKCGKCGQRFDELSQLQLHIRRHEAVQDSSNSIVIAQRNPFATEESKENIFMKFNYQLYNEGGKKSRKHTRFECEYCGKTFSRSGSLQRHLCTHTGDKPFKCENYGKAFSQSSNLQCHLRTHTETNHSNVSTVERHSFSLAIYSITSVPTLETNHSNVITVERHTNFFFTIRGTLWLPLSKRFSSWKLYGFLMEFFLLNYGFLVHVFCEHMAS